MESHAPISNSNEFSDRFKLARSWIDRCARSHKLCKNAHLRPEEDVRLPTRLIRVSEGPDNLRLVLSKDFKDAGSSYVALSHRWGDPELVPKTTSENLDKRLERIPWTDLSRTFQHAILITRELDIPYLWIDSLCIIESLQEDFERECAGMHRVYMESLVTICASSSVDGRGGMLFPHRPAGHTEDLSSKDYGGQMRAIMDEWKSTIQQGPLATRGWAFQERHLATRILHFTTKGIYWECRACVASEHRPRMLYRDIAKPPELDHISYMKDSHYRVFDTRLRAGHIEQSSGDGSKYYLTRWLVMVEQYSAKKLTFERDKLPALSGLASTMSSLLTREREDEYLAGIWKSDLLRSLLWKPIHTTESLETPLHDRCRPGIPSWSWASFRGSVKYADLDTDDFETGREYQPRLISSSVKASGLDPYGATTGGQLTINSHSPIIDLKHLIATKRLQSSPFDSGTFHVSAHFDARPPDISDSLSPGSIARLLFLVPWGSGIILLGSANERAFQRIGVFQCSGQLVNPADQVSELSDITII